MTAFRYTAIGSGGERLAGVMEAATAEEVIARLQRQGTMPVRAEPADQAQRWSGWLKAPRPGRYTLQMTFDDRARLWLDGKLLIDCHVPVPGGHPVEGELTGRPQALRVEHLQEAGGAQVRLSWAQAGGFACSRSLPLSCSATAQALRRSWCASLPSSRQSYFARSRDAKVGPCQRR